MLYLKFIIMRRFLARTFPKLFGTCVHYTVDFEKFKDNSNLQLAIVDPGHESITGVLGLSNERATELGKIAVEKFEQYRESFIQAIDEASKHCNHLNEYTFVVFCMTSERAKQSHPIVKFIGKL